MTNIPNDVMHFCILPRLPVKSLIRFKCVSKSWKTLINSPDFIRVHHRHALSSDKSHLQIVSSMTVSQRFKLHDLDSPSTPPLLLPYPKPVTCTTPMVVDIIASGEFFLLLRCSLRHPVSIEIVVDDADLKMYRERPGYPKISNIRCDEVSGKTYGTITHHKTEFYGLFLLNPATGIYYKIPNSSKPISVDESSIYGLYLDVTNDEYKIFRIIEGEYCDPPTDIDVMVYSNKTNSWKLIEKKFDTLDCMSEVAVIGHLLHIIFRSNKSEVTIGCLDIVAERWRDDVPLPERFNDGNFHCDDLCVFDGLLCVLMYDWLYTDTYQVWVMKEYGVKESWVILMNNFPKECVPVTYCTGSRHEVLCKQDESSDLWLYDIRNTEAKQVEIDGCSPVYGDVCKGSLISFPGGQQINIRRA